MGSDNSLYRSISERMEYRQTPGNIFFSFPILNFLLIFIEIYNSFRYNQDNFLICWIRAMNEITEKNNFNFLDLSNRRALLLSKMVKTLVYICLGAWDLVFGFTNVNL